MGVRRLLFGFVLVAAIAMIGFAAIPRSAPAQSNLEDRVAELETEVAEQGEDIDSLRDRIRALEDDEDADAPNSEEADGDESARAERTELSGTGETLTDSIRLSPGSYRVSAEVEVRSENGFDGFAVVAYSDGDYLDLLFNEFIETNGTWTGSQVLQLDASADIYFEVSNTNSAWTLTIAPM